MHSVRRVDARIARFQAVLVLVVALLCCAPMAHAAQPPDGHARWMGALEGSDANVKGGSIVYDLRFEDDDVAVEKSVGTQLIKQVFHASTVPQGLQLEEADGPIPELSGATLEHVGERHISVKLPSGVVLQLRPSVGWLSWLHYAFFFFVVLMLGNELCRHKKAVAFTLFFIFPLVLIPVWLHAGYDGLFRWVKLYSAIAGSAFFTLYRFTNLNHYRWAGPVVALILAVNIAEAVSQDFASGALANVLNGIAGILNIITISRWMGIRRDESAPHDMLWPGMTTFWILAYDAWNITFVYLNFPSTVFFTVAIIVAPTIAALFIKKGTWMQARAYTLAIYMMYIFSFHALAERYFGLYLSVVLPRGETIALTMACISLASNVAYAVLHFAWRFTGKAPASLQIGQNASVI